MRFTSLVAGWAIVLAACGGGEQRTGDQQQAGTPEQQSGGGAPAGGAAAGGTTHDVDMVLEGSSYKYVPENLTIKAGDVVRFHNKSGGPHNVAFWPDSIPSGAQQVLQANMPDQMAPLQGQLIAQPDGVYEVSFANAPTGEYKYYCMPHLAMGMRAKINVQ